MATVTQPKKFNHEENQRKVRHPLGLVRSYIRRYIILEGVALTLLCASLLFWLGLAADFGLYKLYIPGINIFGVDWILEFNDIDSTGLSSLGCRIMLLTLFVVGLAGLGFSKVVLRWLREFNDRAIALVLERRFHQQLGDRLITAIELHDPKLAKKYGYSQAMVEKTILEAVQTLKKLPVASVFNWRRLFMLWFMLGFSTVGILIATVVVFCLGSLFTDKPMSPIGFGWKFYDVASIWTERNVLMMNTYWPRRSYLEVGRFQPSKNDPNDMRVARDDDRPELQVRAIEWVIADRKAPHGWRALTWKDLSDHKLVDQALLDKVAIPADFKFFQLDTDELEPNLVAALFGTDTEGRSSVRPSGELAAHFAQPAIKRKIDERGAQGAIADFLDWKAWSVDKIGLQRENVAQRDPMVVQPALAASSIGMMAGPFGDSTAAYSLYPGRTEQMTDSAPLEAVYEKLSKLVEEPSMSRTVRRLEIPEFVHVKFRGKEHGGTTGGGFRVEPGNKYSISLKTLAESVHFSFRARGEDYFTPKKTITLVPAPTPATIAIDKEEPAYIYHRLPGEDQTPLQPLKHYTKNFHLSTTGDVNTIEVPVGSKLVIHVRMPKMESGHDDDKPDDVNRPDRKLRAERPVFAKEPPAIDPAFALFSGTIVPDADRYGFALVMDNVTRNHDFMVEFFDEDNIKGKRRFKILRTLDGEPNLANFAVFGYQPRTPRFKTQSTDKDAKDPKGGKGPRGPSPEQSVLAKAYLITPDAYLPFECKVVDDYGLMQVGYHYTYRKVDFELISAGGSKKLPTLQIGEATKLFHAQLALSNFMFTPISPAVFQVGAFHIGWTGDVVLTDIRVAQGYREGLVPSPAFAEMVRKRSSDFFSKQDFDDPVKRLKRMSERRVARAWEFDLKNDPGFDLKLYTSDLKARPLDEIGQMHYHLQIAVQAIDNNIVSGSRDYPVDVDGRKVMQRGNLVRTNYLNFVVVSENELLAQIALDEEIFNEKLEAAKERVDAGMVSLLEQQSKVRGAKPDEMEGILNRMNEIRTALGTVSNTLNEIHQSYDNIAKEMKYNRVDPSRIKKIDETIIARLENIVNKEPPGSALRAENAFQKAYQPIEDDTNAKRAPNAELHQANMLEAHRQMDNLSKEIKNLLDAMSEGILESKLIALIDSIERKQREHSRVLHNEKLRLELLLLDDLLKDLKKDPPKKSSQLTPPLSDGIAPAAVPQLKREVSWERPLGLEPTLAGWQPIRMRPRLPTLEQLHAVRVQTLTYDGIADYATSRGGGRDGRANVKKV